MYSIKDVVGWIGNIAVVNDYNGGYYLVDWCGSDSLHIKG